MDDPFEGYPVCTKALVQSIMSSERALVIFSFGVGINPGFEHDAWQFLREEGLESRRLKLYSFDPLIKPDAYNEGWGANYGVPRPPHQRFHKVGLGIEDGKYLMNRPNSFHSDAATALTTLSQGLRDSYHMETGTTLLLSLKTILCALDISRVDVIKIDIEGLEYRWLEKVLLATLRTTQLVVTFHPQ